MSARAPVVLAISLLILLVVHYLLLPDPAKRADPVVFRSITGEQLVRLELAPADGPKVVIQAQGETRPPNVAISNYQMMEPYSKIADRTAVADVLNMIYRLDRSEAIDASGKNLAEFGLDKPRLVMTAQTTHRPQPIVIRFGKPQEGQREGYSYVWCQVDGEPNLIYSFFKGYVDALSGGADSWRTRQVVSFQGHLVNKIWIETRADAKMSFEKVELSMDQNRQWWLTAPYRDRAEPDRVNLIFDILMQLRAEKFSRDLPSLKLAESLLKIHLFTFGSAQPIEVTVGPFVKEDKKATAPVFVHGSDEAAWVDATRFINEFPGQADIFRPKAIFFYPEETLEEIEIYCHDLGKVVLKKQIEDRPSRRPGQGPTQVARWRLAEPPGLEEMSGQLREIQTRAIHDFVSHLRQGEIRAHVNRDSVPDTDPKFAKPECRLTFTISSGPGQSEKKVFYFDTSKQLPLCYIPLGPNRYEIVHVDPLFIQALKRLEWNFFVKPILEFKPELVREVRFETMRVGKVEERATMQRSGPQWTAAGIEDGRRLSEENLMALLERLKNLQARLFLAKVPADDTKLAEFYGLASPQTRLTVVWDEGGRAMEKTILISGMWEGNHYLAKIADSSIIFQIDPDVVGMMHQLFVLKH